LVTAEVIRSKGVSDTPEECGVHDFAFRRGVVPQAGHGNQAPPNRGSIDGLLGVELRVIFLGERNSVIDAFLWAHLAPPWVADCVVVMA